MSRKLTVRQSAILTRLPRRRGGAPALAKNLSGSKRGETISGTKGADKIKGKGGNDKLKGRGGNDTLNGGKGRDKLTGGAAADKHLGGPGNDTLRAADGRRDKAINGGPGQNTCIIDTALELSIVKGCNKIVAGAPADRWRRRHRHRSRSGSRTRPGRGHSRARGRRSRLQHTAPSVRLHDFAVTALTRLLGTVTGGGGVTGLGAAVIVTGTDWTAAGVYGCTADGFLRVTIGTETADVPVDCTA